MVSVGVKSFAAVRASIKKKALMQFHQRHRPAGGNLALAESYTVPLRVASLLSPANAELKR